MKRIVFKTLLVLLVIAMLCPAVVSCTNEEGPNDTKAPASSSNVPSGTDSGSANVPSATDPAGNPSVTDPINNTEIPTDTTPISDTTPIVTGDVDENGYVKDELDKYNLNFNEDTVKILHWNAEEPEFKVESQDGTKVNDAIWNRNSTIERRLNVILDFQEEKGNVSNISNFVKVVEAARGTETWDIIATYSRTAASLSIKGLYADLNSIEDNYIDFSKEWWPTTLVDTVTIGNALYFVSGDASTNVLHFMYTIYFNKDLKETYTDITEDFYELVRDGEWTLDKIIEFSENKYEDLNANGSGANYSNSDLDDAYGFCTIYYGADAFYTGSGLQLLTHDQNNMPALSEDYSSMKAIDLSDKLGGWLSGADCCVFMGSGEYRQPFVNGNALFCQERAYLASRKLQEATFKYGILPTPKYNKEQKEYITIVGNPFTLYGISTDCTSKKEMTAVIECWGSEGYRQTTPALFYETMQARYADAPDDYEMWEIIRKTACFDLGRIFYKDDIGYSISEEYSKVACQKGNWSGQVKRLAPVINTKIKSINQKYKALQG